ncbi:hypothetical protein [Bacillus atrophaeus]|uniref:hypothetical protein n=1 Tax=Bacillus atrophaeus TaxID=1452 RepID=UPI00228165BE|nr:hypothetical protein [Bacillus atrophaeus]MCY8497604.1 hypothetical protein [Bacillus atrophaeus]MCY8814306.1 hypothetical protein [Bacillus atrophaeus]MCY8816162.1 hypothetical protein [Bacillus atrophaeus]MCY8823097.1 hypothetical protein [Bacillus atrophaeus]MCY8828691.1 hypothetical protein [Bacillus atrophaeus]
MSKDYLSLNTHRIVDQEIFDEFEEIMEYLRKQNNRFFPNRNLSKIDVYNFIVSYAYKQLVKEGQIIPEEK